MIEHKQFRLKKAEADSDKHLFDRVNSLIGHRALRWYIGQILQDEMIVEATMLPDDLELPEQSIEPQIFPGRTAVLSVVPTGIGCEIGGYAGDASPVTNLLAGTADYLITNPNAVNASNFIGLEANNIVYTDGCCIDSLCQGRINLYLPYSNRIGVIIERTEDRQLDVIFNILNTVKAVHGVTIADYVITDSPIGGRCFENNSGAFVGTIDHPEVVLAACERLLAKDVDAIALTSNIADLPMESYAKHFAGQYPNPIGGVEAVISYLVTRRFQIPAAHAPLINTRQFELLNNIVDARGAGEMSSVSGLACVLIGLRRAPSPKPRGRTRDILNINNLLAVVTPASCLGGIPVLCAQQYGIPLIAVNENCTVLNVTTDDLKLDQVIEVRSYAEAAGVLMALRRGISLEAITRPLQTIRYQASDLSETRQDLNEMCVGT